MSFTVAIVGRANVGKSTLFNRLIGKRLALVDDQPGVTRDRRMGEARLGDLSFTAIDTAGIEEAATDSLSARMREQTKTAIAAADAGFYEAYALGLGDPVAVSAEHGEGLADLYEAVRAALPEQTEPAEQLAP